MADGACWPNGKQASIQLSSKDADHLQKFADFVNVPMRMGSSNGYDYARVIVNSKAFVDQFLLMTGNIRIKSQIDKIAAQSVFSKVDSVRNETTYAADFMRGMFDGDGSIGYYNREWRFNLCGEKPMLEEFSKRLNLYLDVITRKPYLSSGCWKLDIGGINRLAKIRSFLYYDENVTCLERKRDKWAGMPEFRGTSKYPGVHFSNTTNQWIARWTDIHGNHAKAFDDEDIAGKWRAEHNGVILLDKEWADDVYAFEKE